jgi:hypothetical protein
LDCFCRVKSEYNDCNREFETLESDERPITDLLRDMVVRLNVGEALMERAYIHYKRRDAFQASCVSTDAHTYKCSN